MRKKALEAPEKYYITGKYLINNSSEKYAAMKIVDISPETEKLYFCCLEDWSDEMKEAGDHKQRWYERMKDKGVRVKLAEDEDGAIAGMIQYLPVEYSMFEGSRLHVVLCIWVHGHRQGIGDRRKKGMGKALLKAAEEDCREMGSGGLVAWGLAIPVFMRASWFKKHGYKVVDKDGFMRLLWKPFSVEAVPPRFMKRKKKPGKGMNRVDVSIFRTGWCPAMNIAYERTLRASGEFGDKIDLHEYDTVDRRIVEEWGISDGIFIDGKELRTGPPPAYKQVHRKIEKRAGRF
jgi:N-acetylglutamate synthase-like GNAT family acetyltransferase